jgi:hypothetical protein
VASGADRSARRLVETCVGSFVIQNSCEVFRGFPSFVAGGGVFRADDRFGACFCQSGRVLAARAVVVVVVVLAARARVVEREGNLRGGVTDLQASPTVRQTIIINNITN